MWAVFGAAAGGSYHHPNTDEHKPSSKAVGLEEEDEEHSLSLEELSRDDPLDAENVAPNVGGRTSHRYAWAAPWSQLLQHFRRRQAPSPTEHVDCTVESARQQNIDTNLLNTDWSSRVPTRSTPTPWLVWPLPSWSHRFFGYPMPTEPRRATDYLDGLRGVAALFVVFFHFLLGGLEGVIEFAFGSHDSWSILALPFFRTVFAGEAMVAVFFVISGYVLSARCIIALRAGDQEKVHTALASMAFRRAIRLFVPSLVASSFALLLTLLGVMPSRLGDEWTLGSELTQYSTYLRYFLLEIWYWGDARERKARQESCAWYGPQLWTIPIEFNGSMILFMLVIATARCSTHVRFGVSAALIVGLLYTYRWDLALFVAGMALAEINIIAAESKPMRAQVRTAFRILRWLVPWTALLIGWYLTGFPTGEDPEAHTGYAFLIQHWGAPFRQKLRFWLAVAAMLVVGSVSFLPPAQRIFSTPVARYLGKISYALYAVHFFVQFTLREQLWDDFHVITNEQSNTNPLSWGYLLSMAVDIPVALWVADLFWRMVDAPSVKLAKWLEGKCFVQLK